ncbi:KpsF/GutQ family sugar-phosphate isomerase [Sulfurospirillum diekertiae]|uniref:KpsF/GutQ family sugar-phosphate isomerase n=1 Tax=Sulfurospirillum diekertiae TaxID=1854492 RepID=A0A6G9VT71_9BACT|nr:KpsF/GutQ family sugar-phosphate isomerase [Sulfurospirillum diekertiae]QIR76091.1 KpsF/GutQ family sugar-phosphate isomerase [Sulfurospirillum diekertiae]QIR78727.1 KpsF/GutQ family sugar-phosphate isomerase [Sulfurospirillum diekertiae]
MEDFKAIAKEVLELEAKELLNAAGMIGNEIGVATNLIANIKGKLIVTGVGKSGLIGAKIAATLASTGTSSFFLHPTEAMHGDLGMVGKDDAVLAISYSGESEELIKILPHIKRFDIPLIGMARSRESSLGHYSDVFLPLYIEKEACPLDAAPTCSTTLTLALGDALAVCLMKKKNFQKEDFASFHPGGSLGKRLFIKVKDLMLTKELPIIHETTKLKEAILKMSEGRLGNVLITDQNNHLIAILSDGDLRRALMRDDFSMDATAYEYATKSPKKLDDETLLASDALTFIEKYKIQLVAITDKVGVLKGVLHIHDLVEAGIK